MLTDQLVIPQSEKPGYWKFTYAGSLISPASLTYFGSMSGEVKLE